MTAIDILWLASVMAMSAKWLAGRIGVAGHVGIGVAGHVVLNLVAFRGRCAFLTKKKKHFNFFLFLNYFALKIN